MSTGYMEGYGRGEIDWLAERMASIGLVDIGRIIGFSQSSFRADVAMYNVVGGQQQVLSDVELLVPGNDSNGIFSNPIGSPCLVIYPRAPVKSTRTGEVVFTRKKFDSAGVKCIPLSTLKRTPVKVGFDDMGNFSISNPAYSLLCDSQGVQLVSGRDNSLMMSWGSENIKIRANNTEVSCQSDGTLSTTIQNPATKETLCSINIQPDGSISIQTAGDLNLESKGSVTLKTEGDSTIDGNVSITGSLTVDGDLSAADGNLTASAGA